MNNLVTIDFRGDTLFAVAREDGVFVAVTPICDALGLDAQKQRQRIQRDPILSEGGAMVALPSAGGMQETFCLRLDLVHGWLFTIDESRVKDETVRQRVLAYKRDCYRVLFEHFQARRAGIETVEAADHPATSWPVQELRARISLVQTCRMVHGVPAAQWLWRLIGLPEIPADCGANRSVASTAVGDAAPEITRFLADCTATAPGARVQSSALFQLYEAWARSRGAASCNQTTFGLTMRRLGHRSVTSQVVLWLDVQCTKAVGDFSDQHRSGTP